jgi:hypothetical protein
MATFPWLRVQAIGSEVAAETSRSAETSAPARTVAVSRAEAKEANIGIPLGIALADPTIGPTPISMHGACQFRKVVVFQ